MTQSIGVAVTNGVGLGAWMAAPFEARDWADALEASCAFLGARSMLLAWQDRPAAPFEFSASPGVDAAMASRCRELLSTMARPMEGRAPFERDLELSWIGRGWNGPGKGLRMALFIAASGPLDQEKESAVADLAYNALRARLRVDAISCASSLKANALDQLPFGVAIVDETLAVEEMNGACRNILGRGDGLALRGGRILCRSSHDQSALARAIKVTVSDWAPDTPIVQIRREAGAEPYVVRPIGPKADDGAGARCLLMIVDPDGSAPPAARIWRAMFGLTECELIIAEGMVAGRRISDIAMQRGVSVETVRSQTKRLFERLGVSSQAEAAARLNRTAPFRDLMATG